VLRLHGLDQLGGRLGALEELEFFTTEVKVLGVYPADPFRDS